MIKTTLACAAMLAALCAQAATPKIPILHSTDLCHPHDDPDDHYDLACLFALAEFDVKGIVLDRGEHQATRPGRPPVEQMMHITGRKVPYAIGLSQPLRGRDDKALEEAEKFQGGVQLILSVLRDAKEKVVLHLAGSCRDAAAAFNREPELFRQKVKAVYIEAGNGLGGDQNEYNVGLSPLAYVRLLESGLPVYWCPCFGKDGYGTYYTADQSAVVGACAPAVQNYFVYSLTKSKDDPIAFLKSGPHPLPQGKRRMWCTAPMLHAAGRKIYQRGDDDFVALSPSDAEKAGLAAKAVDVYQFVPVRVDVADLPGSGKDGKKPSRLKLRAELNPPQCMTFVFRATSPQYGKVLASCLKNLLSELGRSLNATEQPPKYRIMMTAPAAAGSPNPLFAEPCQWPVLRSRIDGYKYYGRQFMEPAERRLDPKAFAAFTTKAKFLVGVEFGHMFLPPEGSKQEPWQRWLDEAVAEIQPVFDAGGRVDTVHIDGPMRRILGFGGGGKIPQRGLPYDQALDQLVRFWVALEAKYPGIRLGYLVNLPNWDYTKEYPGMVGHFTAKSGKYFHDVISEFHTRLTTAGGTISFLEIDCPYKYYTAKKTHRGDAPVDSPGQIRALQRWCATRNIKLHMIVNEACLPQKTEEPSPEQIAEETKKFVDHSAVYVQTLKDDGITPDVFLIQSWYGVPRVHVPETDVGTTTHAASIIASKIHECFGKPYLEKSKAAAGSPPAPDGSKLALIVADSDPSPSAFAAARLESALKSRGWEVRRHGEVPKRGLEVHLATDSPEIAGELSKAGVKPTPTLPAEGFAVRVVGKGPLARVWVIGGDAAGAMYGGLELAERIRAGADPAVVQEIEQRPRFSVRAVKINLPWISYRKHACLQLHDETCRDPAYWRALIDHLAECRFNRLSLWSLHPWCLMVRPNDFPEACDLSDAELDRWRSLWRGIFAHAHSRGMKVQMFTWNIFVSPAFARAHNVATYSNAWNFFGNGDTSDLVRRYNRSVVAQVLREYPELDGLGITQSERMGGMTPEERGQWIADVLLRAIKDAGRPLEINYRIPHSANTGSGGSTSRESESLGRRLLESVDLPGPVLSEVKYNWSHGHSTPKLCIIHGGRPTDALWNPPSDKYRMTWMVRNEDFFCLRWCAPTFVRAHLRENDRPWTGGYYVGSECYIPAKNYIDRPERETGSHWAFQRQRLFYLAWGRLLYDPALSDEALVRAVDGQYGPGAGAALLPALDRAGQTPLRIATLCGATWDHTLYSEGFLTKDGFITTDRLIAARPLDPTWMSVGEFVKAAAGGKAAPAGRTTPLEVADAAEADARDALRLLAPLGDRTGAVGEEIADAASWAHLGLYLADKLRAAVALEQFRTGDDRQGEARAVELLSRCVRHWDAVVAATQPRFREVPLQHTGSKNFSWAAYRNEVVEDLRRAREADLSRAGRAPSRPEPTTGSTLKGAERADGK